VNTENFSSFEASAFTPELTAGIASTDTALKSTGAPGTYLRELYVADFTAGSYQYVGPAQKLEGASTDLSHVVLGGEASYEAEIGKVWEWVNGRVVPVSVTNEGEFMSSATAGSAPPSGLNQPLYAARHDVWHAVSADGSRVYFTSPGEGAGQLYVRVNAEQPQP
jgi:hypothetical protein